ncbi:MAG: outer membrane lipoprotein-sorting protein [Flavobacteriia bacterium]|nr:outer membrane lipoprotein-sorting protein [Flavobacteriia bacterium]
MKKYSILLVIVLMSGWAKLQAQTADDILNNYFENTGGVDAWRAVEGMRMKAKVNQGGMEIPLEIVRMKDGRQMTSITFQGLELKQGVFDGEVLWGTNMMTQKAEKSDAEATEMMKKEMNDFPDPFLDYQDKGYTVELMGKEDFNGTETFKIKLVKEPITVDGEEVQDVSYYFFETENFVPIAIHSEIKQGQAKGMMSEITFSDYQEVEGLYMPFTMSQGVKGQGGQPVTMDSIELNPEVSDSDFAFPAEE